MSCTIRLWVGLLAMGWLTGCQSHGPWLSTRPRPEAAGAPAGTHDGQAHKLFKLDQQSLLSVATTNQLAPEWLRPSAEFFRLGPGDVIQIETLGEADSQAMLLVGPDGKVYYGLLPGTFVWGMTLTEAKEAIEDGLKKYLRGEPKVALALRAVGSKQIWILGSVSAPGVYALTNQMTVLEAVAGAGGTLSSPGSTEELADLRKSFVMREGRLLPVDLYRLLRQGDLSQNIYLQPDDFVYVRPAVARSVYVLGAVLQPNLVPFTDQLSLVPAIASVGGTIPYAYLSHVAIVRGSLTSPHIAVVDYKAIAAGQALDVELEPGDIVYVPFSPYRKLAMYADQILSQFVRTIAINEGRNAIVKGREPVGITVPGGFSIGP